jgi:hypothetical protein
LAKKEVDKAKRQLPKLYGHPRKTKSLEDWLTFMVISHGIDFANSCQIKPKFDALKDGYI